MLGKDFTSDILITSNGGPPTADQCKAALRTRIALFNTPAHTDSTEIIAAIDRLAAQQASIEERIRREAGAQVPADWHVDPFPDLTHIHGRGSCEIYFRDEAGRRCKMALAAEDVFSV